MKLRLKIFSVFIFCLFAFAVPVSVLAQSNFRSGDTSTLPQNETIDRDYFATGKDVSVDGTVNGDAYLAGGNVTVNGTINGDLLAAGGNLNINGEVTGNIRVAGGNITVNGKVGRNVTAAGGSITASPNSQVTGSITSAGGNLNLLGPIGKQANLGGGQINIDNSVGSDVNAAVGNLTLSSRANVNGNLIYWSDTKASINPQAKVSGKVTQNIPPKKEAPKADAAAGAYTAFKIISFLTALVFGLLLIRLFPNFTLQTAQTIKRNWLLSLGLGFLAIAVTPFAVILLLITIVGIPFAILWIFFLVFDLWLAKIFVAIAIGSSIAIYFKRQWTLYLAFLLGLIVYYIIGIIPLVGWLFSFTAAIVGLGAIILTKRNYYQKEKQLDNQSNSKITKKRPRRR